MTPLAGIKVDDKTCLLPNHGPTSSKTDFHRCQKIVAQNCKMSSVPSSVLALGMVAAEARLHVADQQAARTLPWIGIDDPVEERRLQAEHENRMQKIRNV